MAIVHLIKRPSGQAVLSEVKEIVCVYVLSVFFPTGRRGYDHLLFCTRYAWTAFLMLSLSWCCCCCCC